MLATSNTIAATKLAPRRNSDLARATAAYEQDDDAMPRPVSTVVAVVTNWNGVPFCPSAPKCTSVSSEPAPAKRVATAAGL